MAVHEGHRDRVRSRFLQNGLDSFSDIQVLELLLFYCIPRRDTNVLAHALLERFGSLSQVMEAPPSELMKVEGIGESAAAFLRLIPAAGRYYQSDRADNMRILPTLESCAEYLRPRFFGRNVELAFLLCLDAKCKVLCCRQLSEGDVSSTELPVRKIVEAALNTNAASVILAHNHPGGLAVPSREDISATVRAAEALRAVSVVLADHVIFADEEYVSLAQSGYDFTNGYAV